jgi:hypothetical protein
VSEPKIAIAQLGEAAAWAIEYDGKRLVQVNSIIHSGMGVAAVVQTARKLAAAMDVEVEEKWEPFRG